MMIEIRKSEERGHADHGWLNTFHTFSFAEYMDPRFMGFGHLRVLNQDRVIGGAGFPKHGHRNMEIVSFVLEGTLEHKDSMGNIARMPPGEVQIMSAGRGVLHSEYNGSSESPLHFLQMWVPPRSRDRAPSYGQRNLPLEERSGQFCLAVAPEEEARSLPIDQRAWMSVAHLPTGQEMRHNVIPGRTAWLHVAQGEVTLNGHPLGPGDGTGLSEIDELTFEGQREADLVLWEFESD